MLQPRRQHWSPVLLLVVITLFSRFIVRYFYGITFDDSHLYIGWQLLDLPLLRDRLWESLWYLHAQPPVFNLGSALLIRLFPQQHALAMELLFIGAGLLQTLLLYFTLYRLRERRWLAFTVPALWCVSPAFILYESWYFYTFPAMCGLSVSLFFLERFLRTQQFVWGCALFGTLALLCLTVSMFHLIWLLMVAVTLLLLHPAMWRRICLSALVPVLLVSGWYAKNNYLYGQFTASTWMGMNMARIMLPASRALPAAVQNDTTRQLVRTGTFRCVNSYRPWLPPDAMWPAVPVLQEVCKQNGSCNYHHGQYIFISEHFRRAAMASLKAHPGVYARHVITANLLYFAPASTYFYLEENRRHIAGYDRIFNLGLITLHSDYIYLNTLLLVLLYVLVAVLLIRRLIKQRPRGWQETMALYAAGNLLFLMLAGNLLELGENMRFRFQAVPLLLLLIVYLLPLNKTKN